MPRRNYQIAPGHDFNGVMPVVADLSMHATPEIAALKAQKVKVLIRYYALDVQSSVPEKIIRKEEADKILDAGLSLAISYQYNNGSRSTFTPERARQDIAASTNLANEIGQPKESAVYFGVDAGWDSDDDVKMVKKYFAALNEEVNGRFVIGVYGSGLMCMKLRAANLAKFFWIAGLSDAWPKRLEFLKDGHWNMYQNVLEYPIGSVKVDTDIVNPGAAAIGSFRRPTPGGTAVADGPIDNTAALATQRLIKGQGHSLYDQPGGTVLRSLAAGKMVTLIDESGNQAVIDVPRQIDDPDKYDPRRREQEQIADFVRGYCDKAALVNVGDDPS